MTPVSSYLIFLINSFTTPQPCIEVEGLAATVGADSTAHRLIIRENGLYRVGVAARNTAGRSDITYHQEIGTCSVYDVVDQYRSCLILLLEKNHSSLFALMANSSKEQCFKWPQLTGLPLVWFTTALQFAASVTYYSALLCRMVGSSESSDSSVVCIALNSPYKEWSELSGFLSSMTTHTTHCQFKLDQAFCLANLPMLSATSAPPLI